MYFGVIEKPTMDCVTLYNNAGLISKVTEGIASEIIENCPFDNTREHPHKPNIARN